MKELDVLLTGYLERHYVDAGEDDQQHFKTLLEWPDPDLYALLLGREQAPDSALEAFAQRIREFAHNR